MADQIPTIGRIVHYRLSADDAEQIMRRRTSGESIAARIVQKVALAHGGTVSQWPLGAQAHIGNEVKEGEIYPMIITRTWGSQPGSAVNGQVFLDGSDVLWVTSATVGEGPRTFSWPTRA